MSNVVLFLFSPFVQEIPILLKILYGIGLFIAFFILSVLVIRLLQTLFKTPEESSPAQIISESPKAQQADSAGGNVTQVHGDYIVNNYFINSNGPPLEERRRKDE